MSLYEMGNEKCYICGKKLNRKDRGKEWFILSDIIEDMNSRLWQYSGELVHYSCYNNWEFKDEYEKEIVKYNKNKEDEDGKEGEDEVRHENETVEDILGFTPEEVEIGEDGSPINVHKLKRNKRHS